jgi:two-component system response regulator AtoC
MTEVGLSTDTALPLFAAGGADSEGTPQEPDPFLCGNEKMRRVKEILHRVADTDVPVLILGESGVGKEVVARYLHRNSNRRHNPFVKVNCAALPEELLESELFGYERGAFTGASRQKRGKFDLAHGGTLFLDEIAEMSPSLQAKLLQVLQDQEFSRLGGTRNIRVDVRVVAATNRNLPEEIKGGHFREDLYYRLSVVEVPIPPLRDRKEEIPLYLEYYQKKFASKYGKELKPVNETFRRALQAYDWPGNVRELQNVIQRYVIHGKQKEILAGMVSSQLIQETLGKTMWNRTEAAKRLNMSYKTLLGRINKTRFETEPLCLAGTAEKLQKAQSFILEDPRGHLFQGVRPM